MSNLISCEQTNSAIFEIQNEDQLLKFFQKYHNQEKVILSFSCKKCGENFKRKGRAGYLKSEFKKRKESYFLCRNCSRKTFLESLPEEEKIERKKKRSEISKTFWKEMDFEKRKILAERRNKAFKNWLENLSEEEKQLYSQHQSEGQKNFALEKENAKLDKTIYNLKAELDKQVKDLEVFKKEHPGAKKSIARFEAVIDKLRISIEKKVQKRQSNIAQMEVKMVRTFKYTKTGVEGLVERTVIVLNEDETRIGGLDITGESPEKIAKLTKQYENTVVKGFTRRPKGTPKETYSSPYNYRAFSKAKIQQYN